MAWPKGKPRKPQWVENFIPDTDIPWHIRREGYWRVRRWIVQHAVQTFGVSPADGQMVYSPKRKGWVLRNRKPIYERSFETAPAGDTGSAGTGEPDGFGF